MSSAMRGIVMGAGLLLAVAVSAAQSMRAPQGDIEITVGSAAGATPDLVMRQVARILNAEKLVPQPIVVVNRTGGAWTVASRHVLNRKGSERNLYALVPTVFTTPIVQGTPEVWQQLTPLSYLISIDLVLIVRPDSRFKNLTDLLAAARLKPRGISLAGGNVGSTDHMVSSLLEKTGSVRFNYVPHDGAAGVTATFLGGNVDFILLSLDEAYPLLKANKANALAIFSETRRPEPELATIPTAKEQGVNVVWGQEFGLVAPPGLDPAVVAWWDAKLAALVATGSWQAMLRQDFLRANFTRGAQTRARMQKLHQDYLTVLRDVGLAR